MKMCSLLKILDFVGQSFYLSLRGDAFDAFLHRFFFGVKFCFQCQFFLKMPKMYFDGFLIIKFRLFFGNNPSHSTSSFDR